MRSHAKVRQSARAKGEPLALGSCGFLVLADVPRIEDEAARTFTDNLMRYCITVPPTASPTTPYQGWLRSERSTEFFYRICWTAPKCAKVRQSPPKCAKRQRAAKVAPTCAKVRQRAPTCPNVRQSAPKCANVRPRHECQSALGQVQSQSGQKS